MSGGRAGRKALRAVATVRLPHPRRRRCAGFSLVELIVVIVVIGILAGSVALFIRNPVQAYFDAQRRIALADAADTALRRIGRELHGALPNSVRITAVGGTLWLEFVPVLDAGRYRAAAGAVADTGTDPLDFGDPADATFDVLGGPVGVPPQAQLVIFNVGAGDLDVYGGGNRRQVTTAPGPAGTIGFVPTGPWPAPSPTQRFYLVTSPVTYACTPDPGGAGRIERFDTYPFSPTQPTGAALAGAARSVLVDRVVHCHFELNGVLANANGVALTLVLGDAAENARLFSQVHLPNTP